MMLRILAILSLFIMTSCDWQSDPFANDPDAIKNAVAQGTKNKPVPPVQTAVFIGMDSFYDLKEDQQTLISIRFQLTHPEFVLEEFVVHDLEENFPGAVFDEQNMEILWTPPEGYVPAGSIVYRRPLIVSAYVRFDGVVHEVRKSASINVLRGSAAQPRILRVEGLNGPFREGESYNFKVTVRDDVSAGGPLLSVANQSAGLENATPYMQYPLGGQRDPIDPSLWTFRGTLNFVNKEVTSLNSDFYYSFIANSSLGAPSASYRGDFDVVTTLVNPRFFKKDVEFKIGQVNSYSFTIADIKQEGRVSGRWLTSCPATASCSCQSQGASSTCSIKWTPTVAGNFEFRIEGKTELNSGVLPIASKQHQETLKIKVVE